jgi:hypothetical protein
MHASAFFREIKCTHGEISGSDAGDYDFWDVAPCILLKYTDRCVLPLMKSVFTRPYYPLGTIGTVPRAYDIFRVYEGMEGRK